MPIETRRPGKSVFERYFELVAALEAKVSVRATLKRPYRRIRLSRTQRDRAGFGLERKGRARLRGSNPRQPRSEDSHPQSRHQLASVQSGNPACHDGDADHFPLDMSSRGELPR